MSFDHPDEHGPGQGDALKKQTRDLGHGGTESNVREWEEAEPAQERYENLQDLWRAVGGGTEDIEHRP